MRIWILNGPNLNLLGKREREIYGEKTYAEAMRTVEKHAERLGFAIDIRQTNHEGVLIDWLHAVDEGHVDAVLLNAGALSHYSYALHDAISALRTEVYEIHLSDPKMRTEPFRHRSVIGGVCRKTFAGKGIESYTEALDHVKEESSP